MIPQIGSDDSIKGSVLSASSGENSSSIKLLKIIFSCVRQTDTNIISKTKNDIDLSRTIQVHAMIKIDKTESHIKNLFLFISSRKKLNTKDQRIIATDVKI